LYFVSCETKSQSNTTYMVSCETKKSNLELSDEFVAGVISVCGTFFHTSTARTEQFGFQIKLPSENEVLLSKIRDAIGLKNRIHLVSSAKTRYVILTVRSRSDLKSKIIPFIDDRICGHKLKSYLNWKRLLIKSSAQHTI